MKFESAWAFYLLFIIPVIIFLIVFKNRKKKVALGLFADANLLPDLIWPGLAGNVKKGILFFKGLFFVFAVIFLILACAGPRWGSHYQDVQRKGVDIIFLLDVSSSMQAQDVKPDRLERAKREITDFLKIVEGDRVGLVLFAGDAFVQSPLTLDYDALSMFLASVTLDTLPVPGTDIGNGIKTALNAFNFKFATDKVIVLITDGEDNEGRGLQQAAKAMEKGVKIFVYGIGDPSGAPIPDETGGFKKDKDGNLIMSKLNEKDLRKISEVADGRYVRSVTGDLDLDRLYFEGIKKKTEAKDLESGKIKVFEERFYIFTWLSIIFLIIEGVIGLKRRCTGFFLIVAALIFCSENRGVANENPEELYQQGHYQEAEKAFIKKDMNHPEDVRNRYNRGCASFQNSNYEGASAAFRSALKRTDDKKISFRAAYNLGASLFKQGDMQAAADAFKQAIKLNPGDEDSRYNYELALKMAEEKKQQEQKQKEKQDKGQDQNNKDDKKKEDSKDQNKEQDNKKQGNNDANNPEDQNKKNQGGKSNEKKKAENKNQDNGPDGQNDHDRNKEEPEQGKKPDHLGNGGNESQGAGTSGEYQAGDMNRNEAEAFLDNIDENPSEINRFRFRGKDRLPSSGKDW
ncbi:Ca-activated chloride channel-like protein [Desulfosarcina sp. BuS5]|uniref:VWA domain-containing protein n=1 Tax=Desulfosarcina sp. BuS5 TaxID=933262 RepID=UPI000688626A|nr:VWA domain-containing protein [Desulfosarcina sp. BuS5]WDN87509.1 Ca-activated chloride channel-like protein [Desulfosarcina sp. BuS5]